MKKASLLALLSLLLLLLLLSSATAIGSNATRIGDELVGGEEFLMESETARRILKGGGTPKTIPIRDRSKGFCNAKIYASCDGKQNKFYNQRKCGYKNGCIRQG